MVMLISCCSLLFLIGGKVLWCLLLVVGLQNLVSSRAALTTHVARALGQASRACAEVVN